MGITLTSFGIGHPVTNITTTTTVQGGFATSNTTSSEGFEPGVNRWGQAGAQVEFYNEDERDIKYVDFQLVPFNNVGDIVGGIGSMCTVRATGPFKSHRRASVKWNYIWDGFAIKRMGIVETEITYMDGSVETVEGLMQHCDGAMGHGWSLPIFLMLCSLICYIWYLSRGSFNWGYLMRYLTMGFPLPSINYVLMLVFPLLGLIFSRKKDQRFATLFSALNVASCAVMAIMRPRMWSRYGISWMHLLACLLMSVILLLRATGAGSFKTFKSSKVIATWSSVGVCILFTILAIVDAINNNYRTNDIGVLMATYMLIPLYCSYLGAIAIRYRSKD